MTHILGRTPEEVEAHAIAREETHEKFDDMVSQEAVDFYNAVLAEVLDDVEPAEDTPESSEPCDSEAKLSIIERLRGKRSDSEDESVDFAEVIDLPDDEETLEKMVAEGDLE